MRSWFSTMPDCLPPPKYICHFIHSILFMSISLAPKFIKSIHHICPLLFIIIVKDKRFFLLLLLLLCIVMEFELFAATKSLVSCSFERPKNKSNGNGLIKFLFFVFAQMSLWKWLALQNGFSVQLISSVHGNYLSILQFLHIE